jgi:hypothetical protein
MESLKERMAKIVPVAVRRPSYTRGVLLPTAVSEGVIVSKPTVSPVELPTVVSSMVRHELPSSAPSIVTVAEPAVHVYATLQG